MVLNKIVSIIEEEITELSRIVNNDLINLSSLDECLELSNSEDLIFEFFEKVKPISTYLSDENALTIDELKFIDGLLNFDKDTRSFIRQFGFDDKQSKLILDIKQKLQNTRNKYIEVDFQTYKEKIKIYKNILSKLRDNDINIINELDEIFEFLKKRNVSVIEQIDIFKYINSINLNVNNNYNNDLSNDIDSEDDALSEDDLIITNLEEQLLVDLFNKYNIDFNSLTEENKEKLKKYGVYNNINDILDYLSNLMDLQKLANNEEVFRKILLFSTIEKIKEVVAVSEKNGISKILFKYPTILFPKVREQFSLTSEKSKISENHFAVSGSLENYLENIKLLEELNIPIEVAYRDCSTFFIQCYKTARNTVNAFNLYNINLANEDGSYRKCLSVLRESDAYRKIDIAIENGYYDYIKQNLSRLATIPNFYRLKYASTLKNGTNPFKLYKNKGSIKMCLTRKFYMPNSEYGDKEEDTFKLYDAVVPMIPNKMVCEGILKNSSNNIVSQIVLDDFVINQLDKNYLTEDKLIYNFDGVIISRYKVLRHYETILLESSIVPSKDILFYIITLYSMLNEEEINKIKTCIEKIEFTRGKSYDRKY